MSDRLKELQRQRRLVQEQLAWFDREIATASRDTTADAARLAAPVVIAAPATGEPTAAVTDAIIAKYHNDSADLPGKVKRGCFLYFFLALGLVGLGVLALYLLTARK